MAGGVAAAVIPDHDRQTLASGLRWRPEVEMEAVFAALELPATVDRRLGRDRLPARQAHLGCRADSLPGLGGLWRTPAQLADGRACEGHSEKNEDLIVARRPCTLQAAAGGLDDAGERVCRARPVVGGRAAAHERDANTSDEKDSSKGSKSWHEIQDSARAASASALTRAQRCSPSSRPTAVGQAL